MSMEKMTGQTENLSNDTEVMDVPLDEMKLSQQDNEDLSEALDNAYVSESEVPEKIASLSAEIQEFKSPEEIKNEIKRLQDEYEMKKKAWQSFTTISSTDTGLGALGAFGSSKENAAKLEGKFPGINQVLEMIKLAEKKNSTGLKFWKTPELDDFQFQVIKNYLTTGSMGNFTNSKMEAVARETVNKFLSENSQSEGGVANIKQAIWGEHDGRYYEGAIADLNNQLSKMSETK